MKNGKLNKREMATLNKAWEILSDLTEWFGQEFDMHGFDVATVNDYLMAERAAAGLGDFIDGQEVQG